MTSHLPNTPCQLKEENDTSYFLERQLLFGYGQFSEATAGSRHIANMEKRSGQDTNVIHHCIIIFISSQALWDSITRCYIKLDSRTRVQELVKPACTSHALSTDPTTLLGAFSFLPSTGPCNYQDCTGLQHIPKFPGTLIMSEADLTVNFLASLVSEIFWH